MLVSLKLMLVLPGKRSKTIRMAARSIATDPPTSGSSGSAHSGRYPTHSREMSPPPSNTTNVTHESECCAVPSDVLGMPKRTHVSPDSRTARWWYRNVKPPTAITSLTSTAAHRIELFLVDFPVLFFIRACSQAQTYFAAPGAPPGLPGLSGCLRFPKRDGFRQGA